MPQPIGRDLDQTRERFIDWLRERRPQATGIEVEGLGGPKDTGFSSDTLMFTLRYVEGGERREEALVMRLAPATDFPVFPTYDVALQHDIMDALADTPVPVPRMRWLEPDPGPLGSPFYVMERLDGRVPTDTPPYHTDGWIHSELTPAERAQLWNSGLDAMAEVHRLDVQGGAFDFVPGAKAGESNMSHELDVYDRYLDWGFEDRSRYAYLDEVLDWLRAHRPAEEQIGLCWGDSRLANQIFSGVDCVAVIDWEMVFRGDPRCDLGWWITLDRCFSEGIGAPRLPGMPGRAETVARWEKKTGRSAGELGYFEVFAAFRFSAIMARLGCQMKHLGLLPADHEMDRNNLATVTLERLLAEQA